MLMFIPHHPPPPPKKKKNSVGWHRSVLAPCDLPLKPTSWLMELNLIPKGGTEYQWWTHSLQDVTLQHSGDHMAKEQMLKDPSMTIKRHYLRLMCNLGKKGRCTQAFRAAEEMKRRGVVMDVSCYAALIEAALHVSSIDLALETFRQMRTELGKNTTLPEETHNEFISACGFANQWEHAVDLLRDLRSKHVVPQTSAYFSVVRSCCRCRQYPMALLMLKEMEMHSQSHYQAAQELRLELVEVLPNGHWKTWERSRAQDHPLTTWESKNDSHRAN